MLQLRPTLKYGPYFSGYDALKLVALLTMIVDHIGFYFFQDVEILRVIGRIAAPVFFFLVGYGTERRFSPVLLLGAAILAANMVVTGYGLFPLNILFTILCVRFALRFLENSKTLRKEPGLLWFALLIFFLPVALLLEYGTVGLMFALMGVFVRKGEIATIKAQIFCGLTLAFWLIQQNAGMGFSITSTVLFILIATTQCHILTNQDFSRQSAKPAPYLALFLARHTLLLYVAHKVLFQWIAFLLQP